MTAALLCRCFSAQKLYIGDSLLTIDIMLSHTDGFVGGEFCTSEIDDTAAASATERWISTPHEFELGDAIVFRSNQHHSVNPVRGGLRQTLVLELWEGTECAIRHRCMDPNKCYISSYL